ncbi:protein angel homolog 2-like [Diadema setosum]|uniref:protein angel homolog 2-like n=1 Tax=Diadema setosum TaxID=31175 RepID=UPI003B3AE97B
MFQRSLITWCPRLTSQLVCQSHILPLSCTIPYDTLDFFSSCAPSELSVQHNSAQCTLQQVGHHRAVQYPLQFTQLLILTRNIHNVRTGIGSTIPSQSTVLEGPWKMSSSRATRQKRQRSSSTTEDTTKGHPPVGRGRGENMGAVCCRHRDRERRPPSVSSSARGGFTQSDWPKTSAECQWRREAKAYQAQPESQRSERDRDEGRIPAKEQQQQHRSHRPAVQKSTAKSWNSRGAQGPTGAGNASRSDCLNWRNPMQVNLTQPEQNLHPHRTTPQMATTGQGSRQSYFKRQRVQSRAQEHGSGRDSQRGSVDFSIVSYNILAQCLLDSHRHLYRHCPQKYLVWEYRRHNILRELKEANAEIVCLQEVQQSHYEDFFKPQLEQLGYASVYKQRTGDKLDGCVTFYKTGQLQLVSQSLLEYRRNVGCLDRDNVAVIVMLQPRGLPSSRQLCVANTHLLWNPRRGDIKLAQLGLLFAEIERMSHVADSSSSNLYHPIVLCGDFNSLPNCPLYRFVREGHVAYAGMEATEVSGQEEVKKPKAMRSPLLPGKLGVTHRCLYTSRDTVTRTLATGSAGGAGIDHEPSSASHSADHLRGRLLHSFAFSSVYDHHPDNGEITTNHSKTNCTVDYIFYTYGGLRCNGSRHGRASPDADSPKHTSRLVSVNRRALFTGVEVESLGGLPNATCSSDHVSLQARLRILPAISDNT